MTTSPARTNTRTTNASIGTRTGLFLAALLSLLTLAATAARAAAPAADSPEPFDRWYVMEVAGSPAGWARSRLTVDPQHITTRSDMTLEIRRGPSSIKVTVETEFVETRDGTPVSMQSTTTLGSSPLRQHYTFTPTAVEIVSTQADRETRTTAPKPDGVWLTPAASAAFIRKRLEAGAAEFSVRSLDPATGVQPVTTTYTVKERLKTTALGKHIDAVRWTYTADTSPGMVTTEIIDLFGVPIRSETEMMGTTIVSRLATREEAVRPVKAPELLVSTLITPDKPIENARASRRAVFHLAVPEDFSLELPNTAAQRARRVDPATIEITVDLDRPADEIIPPDEPARWLGASAMLNKDDPEILRLTTKALEDTTPARPAEAVPNPPTTAEKAEILRRFVARYVNDKGLDVGFASASETARTRAGDCSEHATLLAAMLRAADIPSRVVSGLIYADEFVGQEGIFGYHMWTQALIDADGSRRWIDLDPTLPPSTPTDATHIALAVSSLADDERENMLLRLAPLLGRLKVRVVSVE